MLARHVWLAMPVQDYLLQLLHYTVHSFGCTARQWISGIPQTVGLGLPHHFLKSTEELTSFATHSTHEWTLCECLHLQH